MTSEKAGGVVAFSAGIGDRARKHKSVMVLDNGIARSARVAAGDHCEKHKKNKTLDGVHCGYMV